MDNTSSEDRRLDAFFVNDLLLAYNTTLNDVGIGASLQVNNLFSERYESNGYTFGYAVDGLRMDSNNYFPQAGRHFMVGLTLKF
jgi:iron complex outermembrane receptor protein